MRSLLTTTCSGRRSRQNVDFPDACRPHRMTTSMGTRIADWAGGSPGLCGVRTRRGHSGAHMRRRLQLSACWPHRSGLRTFHEPTRVRATCAASVDHTLSPPGKNAEELVDRDGLGVALAVVE